MELREKIDPKRYSIVSLFIIAILFMLDLDFFGLVPTELYSSINKGMDRTGEIGLLILLFFIQYIINKNNINRIDFWNKYFVFLFYSIIICGFASIIRYNESIYDIYVMTNFYLLLFLAFPLMNDINNQRTFLKIFWIVNIINLCFLLAQAVLYNTTGLVFLHTISIDKISMRNNLIRFGNLSFAPILIICAFGGCSYLNDKLPKWVINLSIPLGICSVLFIGMTRGMLFPIIISLFIMFYVKQKRIEYRLLAIIVLFISVILLLQLDQVKYMINSIFQTNNYIYAADSNNLSIRLQNISYRMNFFNENPIFGMGIIRSVGYKLKLIANGTLGLFFADDVGNFDVLASYGLFGFIIWGAIWIRWFKILRYHIKNKTLVQNSWVLGLIIYYCISSVTLGYFVPERILSFIIVICLLEGSYKRSLTQNGPINSNKEAINT